MTERREWEYVTIMAYSGFYTGHRCKICAINDKPLNTDVGLYDYLNIMGKEGWRVSHLQHSGKHSEGAVMVILEREKLEKTRNTEGFGEPA